MRHCLWLVLVLMAFSPLAEAQERAEDLERNQSPYRLQYDKERTRKYEIVPLFSLFLPGLDQWWERQYNYAAVYTGTALAATTYVVIKGAEDNRTNSDLSSRFEEDQDKFLAVQLIGGMGMMSSYHAFRTAVWSRQQYGQFSFLTKEETPTDIALSPFRFDYLARWTTLVPLGIVGSLMWVVLPLVDDGKRDFGRYGLGDAGTTFGVSYIAGTSEEAFFRGYLMPATNESFGNKHLANFIQSAVFGLAHVTKKEDFKFRFWNSFAFGLYSGWVSQYRDWTISETVFIHFMWNVTVLTSALAWDPQSVPYTNVDLLNLRF